jgi:surface polysaccharide O-acyltransferase-like enzyme
MEVRKGAYLQTRPNQGNTSVEIIRVTAIILVVFLHATSFPYSIPGDITPQIVSNWWTVNIYGGIGPIGLPLFVMLSGFLLLDNKKVNEPLGVFFKKRFTRIGLPMIFWTIFYLAYNIYVWGHQFTSKDILQGALGGTYYHLWFLYMLIGLYLVTPILRVVVSHIEWQKFKYLIVLWFIGTISTPLILTFGAISFNPLMFVFSGWIGYFLLGSFLKEVKIKWKWPLVLGATFGILFSILGTYEVTFTYGEKYTSFFHDSLSFNFIIASVALFLLLISIPPSKIQSSHNIINRLIRWISQNTLPIYLVHIIVFEALTYGFLGFELSTKTVNPIVGIPLLAFLTFTITAAIVYPLKKVPYVKKLLG